MQDLSFLPPPLLTWFRQNQRPLPWRQNADPYRVWVSEIMLQQTRAETVIPYYLRFVQALPTVADLAVCPEEFLFKLWEGLGYYSRARNMKKAAGLIVHQYGGTLPQDCQALLRLPGIGPYTAGAIASIAFEQPCAAVDGNVMRILSRITLDDRDIAMPQVRREQAQALQAVYPLRGDRGDFTQSLMELGATVCVPNGRPRCERCPIQDRCLANQEAVADRYPVKAPRQAKREEDITVLIWRAGNVIALVHRPEKGVLAGMNAFLHVPGALTADQVLSLAETWGIRPRRVDPLPPRRHVFTHIIWNLRAYRVLADALPQTTFPADRAALSRLALPSAFRQFLPDALAALETGEA